MNQFALTWTAFGAAVVWVMWKLAAKPDRRQVGLWCLLGIGLFALKMLAVQWMPQWADTPIDSLKFQLNAEAMWMNWMGLPVDARAYSLGGYLNYWQASLGDHWRPNAELSYVGVLGTHEWVYTAFLAAWLALGPDWEPWAMLANATMAGAFPAASFILVRQLGGRLAVAHLGALLVALEPSIAVNSAWLIKDTLAGFVALLVAITICRLHERPNWGRLIALALALGLLAGIRFVAFAAYVGALCAVVAWLLRQRSWKQAVAYATAGALSLVVWAFLYFAPVLPSLDQWTNAIENPMQAQARTLVAVEGGKGVDESVLAWTTLVQDRPAWAAVRSVLRTLMAPYPWVAFTHGLSGTNHLELYLPGTALWILSLPAILVGMLVAARQEPVKTGTLLSCLLLVAGAYILFFGEWSTRQRVFMIPLFFAFAAMGWDRIRLWLAKRGQTDAPADGSSPGRSVIQ
jgi:hypothetical protein